MIAFRSTETPFGLLIAGGAAATLVLGACTGSLGDTGDEIPGPPDVAPQMVPASPELIESEGACTTLRAGEKLVSVSPEGHAWLALPGEASSVRVLDPFAAGGMLEETHDLELGDVQATLAWSGKDAAIIAGGRLWRLDDLARLELTPPEGFTAPASFCGNPSENGSILSAGKLFEHRMQEGEWWSFAPRGEADGVPNTIVGLDGECQSRENLMWLTARDGTIFRLEPSEVSRPVRFPKLIDAAATGSALYVLESDRLWAGPDVWSAWTFSGEVPASISASNGAAWMAAGAQLLRFDGTTFVEVAHTMSEPITEVAAHGDGVWIAGTTQICHQATGPMIRVGGVRPNMRSLASEHEVQISVSEPGVVPTATVDGKPVTLGALADGAYPARLVLDSVGWHEIAITAGATTRNLLVKRLPEVERSWSRDVEPIFVANCATGDCHGGNAYERDLRSIEQWKEKAADIRQRVIDTKEMPPAGSPALSKEDVEIISQWIEGGMLP